MVKLDVLPEQAIIDGFKGKVDFYYWNGIPCARKWPRSPGHKRAPAVEAQWPVFTAAVHTWPTLSEYVQDAYRTMASGSGLSGRDLFIRGYIKGLYGHDKPEEMLPSCWAYLNTQMNNLTSGDFYKILYDAEVYDYGGNFNPGTNQFTAPRAGRYLVTAHVLLNGVVAVGTRWIRISQNGAEKVAIRKVNVAAGWGALEISCVLDLAANDLVQADVRHDCGINTVDVLAYSNWTNIFIALLQ